MESGERSRRLVPKPGFGQAVYDLVKRQRRPDGSQWEAEDLAAALTARGFETSGTAVRDWIKKGAVPSAPRLVAMAEILDVDAVALLRGEIHPIKLVADEGSGGEPTSGATATAERLAGHQGRRARGATPRRSGDRSQREELERAAELARRQLGEYERRGGRIPAWQVFAWFEMIERAARPGSASDPGRPTPPEGLPPGAPTDPPPPRASGDQP